MTALAIATQIPSNINTVEMLNAWSSLVLSNLYANLTAIEGVGYTERVAQSGIFYVANDAKYRLLNRSSLEVSPDHLAGGAKIWTYARELGNTAIPSIFTSN